MTEQERQEAIRAHCAAHEKRAIVRRKRRIHYWERKKRRGLEAFLKGMKR